MLAGPSAKGPEEKMGQEEREQSIRAHEGQRSQSYEVVPAITLSFPSSGREWKADDPRIVPVGIDHEEGSGRESKAYRECQDDGEPLLLRGARPTNISHESEGANNDYCQSDSYEHDQEHGGWIRLTAWR